MQKLLKNEYTFKSDFYLHNTTTLLWLIVGKEITSWLVKFLKIIN